MLIVEEVKSNTDESLANTVPPETRRFTPLNATSTSLLIAKFPEDTVMLEPATVLREEESNNLKLPPLTVTGDPELSNDKEDELYKVMSPLEIRTGELVNDTLAESERVIAPVVPDLISRADDENKTLDDEAKIAFPFWMVVAEEKMETSALLLALKVPDNKVIGAEVIEAWALSTKLKAPPLIRMIPEFIVKRAYSDEIIEPIIVREVLVIIGVA